MHDPRHQSFSIRFLGAAAKPQLMIFFDGMYDATGSLLPDRIAPFRALQAEFGLPNPSPADQSPDRARS